MFKFCARASMVVLTAILIPVGGFFFTRMVDTMDAILLKLELVSIKVHMIENDLRHMVQNDLEMKRRLVVLERDRHSAIEPLP